MDSFETALAYHQNGQLAFAEVAYRDLIIRNPAHIGALTNLGVLCLQDSSPGSIRFNEGLSLLETSLQASPLPHVHKNLASALVAVDRLDESDHHFLAAIQLAPGYLDAYIGRALLLKDRASANEALAWLQSFKEIFGSEPAFNNCLGGLFFEAGFFLKALESFDLVIGALPGDVIAWYNRGNALRLLRRYEEARTAYRRCLRLKPNHVESMINLGVLDQGLKLYSEAMGWYSAALKLDPNSINAKYNQALVLENMGRFEEAVIGYTKTLELSPAYPYLVGRRHHAQMQMCDWVDYSSQQQLVCAGVGSGFPTSVPFSFLAVSDDLTLQRQCAETYTRDKFPMASTMREIRCEGIEHRIRVGYFSSDFRTHAVGFLTAGIFENHNRDDFEVFAVSLGGAPEADIYRSRIAGAVEHFIDASTMTDGDVVELARTLGLDIAVDLSGHTMDARTAIFAQRVAQVQVNYLGYPGSMGAPYIDVILADEVVVPLGAEAKYTEQVVRLPHTFQINDDQRQIGDLKCRSYYGLPEESLVFASFNTSYKINPPLFDIWCRLLQAAPESVLWLFGENEAQIANLCREASIRNVAPERLIFAARIAYVDHLARYAHVDLVLDTLPFNGGTSTSDALWGGAPVLTCMGKSFAGRMSASLLRAVGLPELITESLEAYEALGKELASDTTRLADVKVKLQANRLQCPLFDTKSQTRDIENAYREMLSRDC